MASESLRSYVAIANQYTDVHRHSKLLNLLAAPQHLEELKAWIMRFRPWNHDELIEEIDKQLK